MQQEFLRFKYAAIKRFGDKKWTAVTGYIEFSTRYTVSVSRESNSKLSDEHDIAYMVELSNGTRFLCYMHNYGDGPDDMLLSESGEVANSFANAESYERAKRFINQLNSNITK